MNGSVRRRSKNSWELTLDLGKDADGKRQRRFVNVKGKRTDADRKLRELMASLDKGLPINTKKITVSEWLDRWIAEHIASTKRQRTIERYSDVARKHIAPHIGHMQLTNVTPSDVKALEAA